MNEIPGLNIQWPWSRLILDGSKTIETRSYPIPEKYLNVELAIIETPGPHGKKAGIDGARIVGTIKFSGCFRYNEFEEWAEDYDRHCVPVNDPQYKFSNETEKWGWIIKEVKGFRIPRPAPVKRGIVFATSCEI